MWELWRSVRCLVIRMLFPYVLVRAMARIYGADAFVCGYTGCVILRKGDEWERAFVTWRRALRYLKGVPL